MPIPDATDALRVAIALAFAVAGCTPKQPAAPVTLTVAASAAATAVPMIEAPAPSEFGMIAAGEAGIFDLGPDGLHRARIGTATHAHFPRYLPGGRSLVFVSDGNTLRRLDLATGKDVHVTGPWVTALSCGTSDETLEIQTDTDVVLDDSGQYLCIDLYDRNINMASAGASVRIDLVHGTLEQRATLVPSDCTGTPPDDAFRCHATEPTNAVTATFPYTFDENNFTWLGPSNRSLGKLSDFTLGSTAPGGRWVLLWGNQEDGDYIHMNLLVLDRLSGTVIPVPDSEADTLPDWPAPLTNTELLDPSRANLGQRAGDFVSESSVRFIGADRLLAGDLLLLLELQRVVAVPGDLAR